VFENGIKFREALQIAGTLYKRAKEPLALAPHNIMAAILV